MTSSPISRLQTPILRTLYNCRIQTGNPMDVSTCVAATLQIADIVEESSIVSFHAIFKVDITCDCGAFVMSPRMYERDNTHTTLRTRVCYHTVLVVVVVPLNFSQVVLFGQHHYNYYTNYHSFSHFIHIIDACELHYYPTTEVSMHDRTAIRASPRHWRSAGR